MSLKRKREDDDLSGEEPDFDDEALNLDLDALDDGDLNDETLAKIRKFVDSAQVEGLDAVSMKRYLAGFERAVTKNTQLRVKYPGQPDRFVESEVELDEEIKKLHAISSAPNLYEEFVHLGAHNSILGLLIHENSDIAADVIDLIKELTDTDVAEENHAAVKLLVETLLENQISELLVSNIQRLNERDSDERQGIYNILGIFENFLDVKPELSDTLGSKTELLSWLLKRIQGKEFDSVKQYSSEILAIMLQSSKANQIKIGKLNGIEILLTAIAKESPQTSEEEEFVENLFNCLCSTCVRDENKNYFAKAEGLKLLQIMIKNKGYVRRCALRLLDYVTMRDAPNCRRWINLPGLGTLFSAFMKTPKKTRKGFDEKEDEEHIASIICSLFRMLEVSEQGKLWTRVLDKFRENDMQKVERLMELFEKYRQRVKRAGDKLEAEYKEGLDDGEELDSDEEEEIYMAKLDAGLFTLQSICYIIAIISNAEPKIKEKVKQLLTFQDSSFHEVKVILDVYAEHMGGGDVPAEETEKEQDNVKKLAAQL